MSPLQEIPPKRRVRLPLDPRERKARDALRLEHELLIRDVGALLPVRTATKKLVYKNSLGHS